MGKPKTQKTRRGFVDSKKEDAGASSFFVFALPMAYRPASMLSARAMIFCTKSSFQMPV